MSRRRQTYRPYQGPSDEQLHLIRYGQAARVVEDDAGPPWSDPLFWAQAAAATVAGVLLMPVVGAVIWVMAAVAGALR